MPGSAKPSLRESLHDRRESPLKKYIRLAIGKGGILALLNYELRIVLFEGIPGAIGIFLRRHFYRSLFKSMGRNVVLGKGITIRHPSKISLGNNVAIDDYSALDARGGDDSAISIGDNTIISRNTILRTKDGTISIGRGSGIGSNCLLASSSKLEIGENLLMASCVCVLAGGEHAFDRVDIPIVTQGMVPRGGITIGRNVWLGTHVTVLDGARIGDETIIGACSLVNRDIPEYAVAYGTPAKVIRDRREANDK